jgi:xanthine dehydrogenase YagT iron-sulfur-binding subunit
MPSDPDRAGRPAVSRRGFLGHAATVSAGVAALGSAAPAVAGAVAAPEKAPDEVVLSVNGRDQRLRLDPRVTLLDALRDRLDLVGSKKGCDRGQCGACTVHVDGRRVLSCLTLAHAVQRRPITTIEGLAHGDRLHPMQQAFIDRDAFQCGFCTSGQIMSAVALTREGPAPSDAEIRESMSGNLCRCGAYNNIVDAVKAGRSRNGEH